MPRKPTAADCMEDTDEGGDYNLQGHYTSRLYGFSVSLFSFQGVGLDK